MQKRQHEKSYVIQGRDVGIMAKFLVTSIQANLCCLLQAPLGVGTKLTRIVVIKTFAFILPSQPLLGHHLGFHNFIHAVFFCMGRTFFYSLSDFV